MDELDKELFSSALKKINSSSSSKFQRDFDEDDPLGDLLSSSGENTPIKSFRNEPSSKETPDLSKQQSKSKLIANLFGLNEHNEATNAKIAASTSNITKSGNKVEDPGDWLGLKGDSDNDQKGNFDLNYEKHTSSNPQTPPSLPKVSSRDDDFLSALSSRESFKASNTSKTPTAVLSDELVPKSNSHVSRKNVGDLQESKKTSSILSSFISDFDSKPNFQADEPSGRGKEFESGGHSYMPSASAGRESRRSTRRRGDIADPLGLFSSTSSVQPDASSTKETQEMKKETAKISRSSPQVLSDQVPQWLGGAGQPSSSTQSSTALHGNQIKTTVDESASATKETKPSTEMNTDVLTALANLEIEAGEAATQQQKSLISALALKRHEDGLLQLQAQQAALLAQQEQQLGALVQRQLQRQQQMIRQQEQIQTHIQALMVQQPPIAPIALPSTLWNVEESSIHHSHPQINVETARSITVKDSDMISELKGQVQRLEIENQDLKAQLESEKQRHESNLADIENLFRRQLTVQEEAMVKQEKRFVSEIDAMEKDTASRISRLKEEHAEAFCQQTQRMAQLHGEWLADLQRLGEFHQQAVEMLRSEQTSAVEHWKNLQVSEIAATKEVNSNARLLEAAVNKLQESSASVAELKDQLRKESQSQYLEKQEFLLKQEVKLTALQEALEKQTAALDAQRESISSMTRDLESRLLRQQQEMSDEKRRFESREKAWEREKLGAIELLNQEKKHLEQLQSQALAELTELGEKKLALAAEVASLETTLHIQSANANKNSQQAEQMVAEARSTLEAAQEAGRDVQREREEIISLKHSLSSEQKRLANLEKDIQSREQKIKEELLRAKAFREEGTSALNEARRLERERTEHASDLAQRLLFLKEREDRLAEEKLAITMEWKKIQESRETATCSSCSQATAMNPTTFCNPKNFVDPLPIIMKLEAEQGLDYFTLDHPRYHSSLLESVSQ